MTEDARFEDAREAPLNLGALEPEDLQVISALVQDAIVPLKEMRFLKQERRFALLVNRFRWEDGGRDRHGAERVQSMLVFENVLGVAGQGISREDPETILSILSVDFTPDAEPPGGTLVLTLAGDGAIRLTLEALEVRLRDVTRPYRAPSGKAPDHGV
ncbi:DUF2948 family protein [Pseudooceanicola sp. CBS1P-1]|uniref:DUF2948 family protein n=1 Tax=Pseudooceanicola albus TaxID=2692189 RepID=A0A6L7GAE9_9RHOB|nr:MULTISPECIES: DUF2948 family protein [Pseudooceanicola]MBT9386484.1 DUF2948 family protein [Pseudooceanicola endophyticus]MXN20518.1 DUF2948 family protein [Pseudooceanicola albus]